MAMLDIELSREYNKLVQKREKLRKDLQENWFNRNNYDADCIARLIENIQVRINEIKEAICASLGQNQDDDLPPPAPLGIGGNQDEEEIEEIPVNPQVFPGEYIPVIDLEDPDNILPDMYHGHYYGMKTASKDELLETSETESSELEYEETESETEQRDRTPKKEQRSPIRAIERISREYQDQGESDSDITEDEEDGNIPEDNVSNENSSFYSDSEDY